jgi:hypothetical protein
VDHYVIHDRDAIFSSALDAALKGFGVRVLKTPVRAPKANAFCERLIGIPEPPQAKVPAGVHRHRLPAGNSVKSMPILGGLHHEYRLEKEAA